MYKKITIISLILGCVAVLGAQEMPTRVAVIDVDRVVLESAEGKAAFKHLQDIQRQKIEEAKQYETELMELEKKLNEQKFILSDAKLSELRKEYEAKGIAFKRFKDDTQRELDTVRQEELSKLEKRIMPIIEQMGRENNYALIFNKFNSGLVYAADAVDITGEVLRRFNTQVNIPPPKK